MTNDAISYAMPTNGVEYMPWTLRGGYETRFPLDLGDFAFPFGTAWCIASTCFQGAWWSHYQGNGQDARCPSIRR